MANNSAVVTLDVRIFDRAQDRARAASVRTNSLPAPSASPTACGGAPKSEEPLGGLWQITRTGVILPARGGLVVPAKYAPPQRRCPGRVEGPALPLAQSMSHVARQSGILL
jgi:hypothetical protein